MTKEQATRRPIATGLALAALCVLGFALRLRGVGHLLPTITQLDASAVLAQVHELRVRATVRRAGADASYARSSPVPAPPAPKRAPPEVDEHLAARPRRGSGADHSIVLSMLLVPLTWLFARVPRIGLGLPPGALVATSSSTSRSRAGAAARDGGEFPSPCSPRCTPADPSLLAYLLAGAGGLAMERCYGRSLFALAGASSRLGGARRRRHVAGSHRPPRRDLLPLSLPFYFEPTPRSGSSASRGASDQSLRPAALPRALPRRGFRAMPRTFSPTIRRCSSSRRGLGALAWRIRVGRSKRASGNARGDALVAAAFLVRTSS